ncbi:MAG: hypothetical protein L6Q33_06250 [Bacteriovoracaceae bacterium]|nr:hypothetical protein [Bacteriovoracaceae bacterium]
MNTLKLFLLSLCFVLSPLTPAVAAEVDKFPLLKTEDYNLASGGNTRSKFILFIGDSVGAVDLGQKVKDSMKAYEKDLGAYFKPGELNTLIDQINARTKKDIIKGDLSDAKARQVLSIFGNELIGKIADRIMEKQGVKEKARRDLWVAKILGPYNQCNRRATNAYYHSKQCLEALAGSLVPNTGTALVYELSKANLASNLASHEQPAFLDQQVNHYLGCIRKAGSDPSAGEVTNCSIAAMKIGVKNVTKTSLAKQVMPSVDNNKAQYQKIENAVYPQFQGCVDNVGGDPNADLVKEFYGCIDTLVMNTGGEVVSFRNIRKDGMLDTTVCETKVTNSITYAVILNSFDETAKSSASSPKEHSSLLQKGKKALDSCWNPSMAVATRESCIRKSVISFADSVAVVSFDKAIPSDLKAKATIQKEGLAELKKCLETNLPKKPSEDSGLNGKIDKCKYGVTLSVAVKTAEESIKDLGKDLPPAKLQAMLKSIVQEDFKKCLGKEPTDKVLDRCSTDLKITSAKEISEALFAKNIDDFVAKNGGAQKLGLTNTTIANYKQSLTRETNQCIEQGKSQADVMIPINKCLKGSIKNLALYLGNAQFSASTSDMYKDRKAEGDRLSADFQKSLRECLAAKDSAQHSIGDYTANIDTCSDKVGKSAMLSVGTDQIDYSLNNYLADAPNSNQAQTRAQIKTKLLGSFQQCLKTSKDTNPCIDNMKRDATQTIVLAYGASQVKSQLTLNESPAKIKTIEEAFKVCTAKAKNGDKLSTELDECIKAYAIEFAKTLGEMKVVPLLKKTLGTDDYNKNKTQTDTLMNNYKQCLQNLYPVSMADGFMEKLAICTKGLEQKTIGFVKSVVNNWMNESESSDKVSKQLKDEFSLFLPCLGAVLPGEPWSEDNDKQVDSMLKPVAILLGQYIDYDINVAGKTLQEITAQLAKDLSEQGPDKAKTGIVDLLAKNGALDQLLKTMVRSNVVDAFKAIPDKEIPASLKEDLTKRETINAIFEGEFGKRLKEKTLNSIIKPALLQGADLSGPALTKAQDDIKNDVVVELVNSSRFGTKLVDYSIEKSLKETGWFTKFVGKALYSKDAFDWSNLKTTPSGKAAERFIKDNVLLPKFQGKKVDPAEEKKLMDQAEEMVTQAVKKYSDEKKGNK